MRALLFLITVGILAPVSSPWAGEPPPKKSPALPPGMRVYFVGLLKKGPKWNPAEEADMAKFLADHVGYLAKLEKDGRVAVAGSFLGASNLRGMVIYKVPTMTEARALVRDDPGVQSGRLLIDLYPWMSADGLRVVSPAGSPRKGAPKSADKSNPEAKPAKQPAVPGEVPPAPGPKP